MLRHEVKLEHHILDLVVKSLNGTLEDRHCIGPLAVKLHCITLNAYIAGLGRVIAVNGVDARICTMKRRALSVCRVLRTGVAILLSLLLGSVQINRLCLAPYGYSLVCHTIKFPLFLRFSTVFRWPRPIVPSAT